MQAALIQGIFFHLPSGLFTGFRAKRRALTVLETITAIASEGFFQQP